MNATSLTLACVTTAVLASGCTVKQTDVPSLTGPSEFALSVSMSATPDTLVSGSTRQATITVEARDPSGAPKSNQPFLLRLNPPYLEPGQEFGTLSSTSVVTGSDGRAVVTYVMPTFSRFLAGMPGRKVSVVAQPIGSDFNTSVPHSVALQVVPPAREAVAGAPTPSLSHSTSTPKVGDVVTFDASGSRALLGSSVIYYYWNFGDGLPNNEHGPDASHAWTSPGEYVVVLGIEDSAGRFSNMFIPIVVTP